jgi:hypothetical protein
VLGKSPELSELALMVLMKRPDAKECAVLRMARQMNEGSPTTEVSETESAEDASDASDRKLT